MRISTGLFAAGGLLYLIGLYGFTTFLPGYRESLPLEIEAMSQKPAFLHPEDRRGEEWRIRNRHAQWESILHPAFMCLLGTGMIVTGVGAFFYLRDRRRIEA